MYERCNINAFLYLISPLRVRIKGRLSNGPDLNNISRNEVTILCALRVYLQIIIQIRICMYRYILTPSLPRIFTSHKPGINEDVTSDLQH